MELRHLRTFLTVAEEESITSAARRLFTAQPAVTRQIQQLEASLDTSLFDRTPQGVTLTPSGESLRPEAKRLVAHADSIADDMRNDCTRLGGLLRVGVLDEGLGVLGPVVLAAYRAAHPNVDVVLDYDADLHQIRDLADPRSAFHDVILWDVDPDCDALGATSTYGERLQLAVPVESDCARSVGPVAIDAALEKEFSAGAFSAAMTPSPRAMVGVALVDLGQTARTDIGVITRSGEQRPHVTSFCDIAASVGRALYSLVREALPPDTE